MTSLSDVYEGGINTVADPRQRRLGMALFAVGAAMVVGAIPVATTELSAVLGLDLFAAREVAGILAGLGIPAVFVGLFVVVPASDRTRAVAALGASLAVLGVLLFGQAYPYRWLANDPQVALVTTAVYTFGTLLTLWALFISVATFNRRIDPGGTARIELTEEGNVRVISAGRDGGTGSVGLFGGEPDGSVPTQTNATTTPEPASDGSGAVSDDALVDDEIFEAAQSRGMPDEYCGNCDHFKYVRVDGELVPYCGFHAERLNDMDACEQWEENN
ncbi:hypothetical protein GRX03_13690 [Halovenus sp. WSH3]|uniref:Uncharacterized protein n=1 Tax=Halovenus carboxidivorans TaxID=2692199 RepID=A0A6B0TAM1_9EURY|nr:hypothetical protein [Halovenus carboxidivorans]MXR52653.1 hypothetical protein [Halovenus carboxidivorans]